LRLLGFELRRVPAGEQSPRDAAQLDDTRKRLALSVTAWGMLSVAAISITAIASAAFSTETSATAMSVLTAVLPLIGTWVGTVLAFFFARENFDAASRASERLLAGRTDRPALDVARKPQDIRDMNITGQSDDAIQILAIRTALDNMGHHRIPLMTDNKKKVRYVVHRQPLETYMLNHPAQPAATLAELLASEQGDQIRDSIAFINEKATLAEAKVAMEARPSCQDVFITQGGSRDGEVLGWLTNNALQRALEA
jgi:hypothetical protein